MSHATLVSRYVQDAKHMLLVINGLQEKDSQSYFDLLLLRK